MKVMKLILTTLLISLTSACGNSTGKEVLNQKGFTAIEKSIKSQFGKDAYFTDVSVTHNKSIGNIVGITVTEEPASLKMGQWNFLQGNWEQNSEISIEVPTGVKAADFMFQLDEKINLSKLGELVETSIKTLQNKKQIEDPSLHMAAIKFPKNGDIVKTEYLVMLQPKNGGTTFTFQYKLNGDLIKMDY